MLHLLLLFNMAFFWLSVITFIPSLIAKIVHIKNQFSVKHFVANLIQKEEVP